MSNNPYDKLPRFRGQCNSPAAASAAERAASKREFKREVVQSIDEAARAEMEPHRPKEKSR